MRRAARNASSTSSDLLEWRAQETGLSLRVEDIGRWRAFAQTVLTKGGTWRKSLDVRVGFPPGGPDKATMLELISELKDDLRISEVLRELLDLPRAPLQRLSVGAGARRRATDGARSSGA